MSYPELPRKRHNDGEENRVFAPKARKFKPASGETTQKVLPNRLHSSSSGPQEEMITLPPRSALDQPDWFAEIPTLFKGKRSDLIAIQQLKSKHTLAKTAVAEHRDSLESIENVRGHLQYLSCAGFLTKALIKKSNILTDRTLHEIFDSSQYPAPALVPYPVELQSDARRLYKKWFDGDIDNELLRSIKPTMTIAKKSKNNAESTSPIRTYAFEPDFLKVSSKFVGEGHLKNGDWWPLQIAAVRDGAHGDPVAGISGYKSLGALSIVMNMATEVLFVDPMKISFTYNSYPNFDIPSRDQIWYCGTPGHETEAGQMGKMSTSTELLKISQERQRPIRVLRGYKVKSELAPAKGLRYDGLYRIMDSVCRHPDLAIWIFQMERLPGQPPIRYQGPDVRPNREELKQWTALSDMMAGRKSG